MTMFAGGVVVTTALFLLGLAGATFVRPSAADRFLLAFAGSARVHVTEQAVRLVVGASLVAYSPEMWQAEGFRLVGWILIVTTLGLLCVPWRWHRSFANRVVPPVLRFRRLLGIGAAILGSLVLLGVFGPG